MAAVVASVAKGGKVTEEQAEIYWLRSTLEDAWYALKDWQAYTRTGEGDIMELLNASQYVINQIDDVFNE